MLEELASPSSSSSSSLESSSSSDASEASRGGEGDSTKPPRRACRLAIRPTWVFTWYSLVMSVSRRASMRWSCAMIAQSHTSLQSGRSGGGWSRRSGRSYHIEPPRLKLHLAPFNSTASMAHIMWKWSNTGKGTENWRKILVIAERKMSLSQVTVSLCTFMIERMKWERKSIVKCSKRESKNQAWGSVIEL